MRAVYPGIYRDEHGEEKITIESDGKIFSTVVRGIRFEGPSYDDLEAQDAIEGSYITLSLGSLSNCSLVWSMPFSITFQKETIIGTLDIDVDLAKQRLPASWTQFRLSWIHNMTNFSVVSKEHGLYGLKSAMPQGYFLKCCNTCAFAEDDHMGSYPENRACFRDKKEEILAARSKTDISKVWKFRTEIVHETHLCPEHQPKTKI
jgi:hypothetical protein